MASQAVLTVLLVIWAKCCLCARLHAEVGDLDELHNEVGDLDEESMRRACDDKMKRMEELKAQDLTGHVGKDPYFPQEQSSIGPPDADCGDVAKGAGAKSRCSNFNRWSTFQNVAEAAGKRFEVFGGDGVVKASDIRQGKLGDCYFMSALASIIFSGHKGVIENMFIDRDLWKTNVYRTRWLLGGTESTISVDNTVPAYKQWLFFADMGLDGEFWPVILEKAWAKIFANYFAAEHGRWVEAVAAITRAPVFSLRHAGAEEGAVWDLLVTGQREGYPMAASSGRGALDYGMAASHGYSVVDAKDDASGKGKIVRIYNPWRTHYYRGSFQNEPSADGTFWMLFSEYLRAFTSTLHAKMHLGHQMRYSVPVPVAGPSEPGSAMMITTESSQPFVLALTWPSGRMLAPCKLPPPKINFAMVPRGAPGKPRLSKITQNSARIDVLDATPGSYDVTAYVNFPGVDYVKQVFFTAYAEAKLALATVSNPSPKAALQVLGPVQSNGDPCDLITAGEKGTFRFRPDKTVFGVPTYWSSDNAEFLYFHTNVYLETTEWRLAEAGTWSAEAPDEFALVPALKEEDLKCA